MGQFHPTKENLMIGMLEIIVADKHVRSYGLLSILVSLRK